MLESQYKMNLIKIGLKIAYYRKLQGMTQEELAEARDSARVFRGERVALLLDLEDGFSG